ncbi:hypothetical protein CP533_4515 [Ophiocordyceps camponoti-saundersi (nom. inval.)]|nr:hypothetical protein CP533_4515 [Ophiocordyceps camponoti-saundersi (nom. inval.)]
MSNAEDLVVGDEPPAVEPYEILGLDRSATPEQIKSAYRKAALKNHPDKVSEDKKVAAHSKFQSIAFAYAVLSDPVRRKRFDATGSTAESVVDSDGFDWSDFYREQFKDAVSADAIEKFAREYKGSDEEKDDVLAAYEECQGDLDGVYERVMLSNVGSDDVRFRRIIDEAIQNGDVDAFTAYTKESKRKRTARLKAATVEEAEAEDYAKELGVHDELFGSKKKKSKKGSEDSLAALIQKRQQDRSANFIDQLAEKYVKKDSKRKRALEEKEPSEEAFREAADRLKGNSKKGSKAKRHRHRPCTAMSKAPALYPRYCFHLSPTFNSWCLLHAREIHSLEQHDGFQGQFRSRHRCSSLTRGPFSLALPAENFFFHGNLPIRWVRVVGVVVAVDDFASRRVYTVDDSSGACIEALPGGQEQDDDIDVGSVVDVKGGLSLFRDEKQIKIERIKRLRTTADELVLWERRAKFRRDVLDRPWVLERVEIRRCRREAERSEKTDKRKGRRRPDAGVATTNGNGRQQDDVTAHVRDMIRSGALKGKWQMPASKAEAQTRTLSPLARASRGRVPVWLVWLLTAGAQASVLRTKSSQIVTSLSQESAPEQPIFIGPDIWHQDTNGTLSTEGDNLPTSLSTLKEAAGLGQSKLLQQKIQVVGQTSSAYSKVAEETRTPSSNWTWRSSNAQSGTEQLYASQKPPPSETFSSPTVDTMGEGYDIFAKPIDLKAPPATIQQRQDHPVPRKGIKSRGPLETNKFYANFFLGDQLGPIYTFPYSLQWAGGKGKTGSHGMSISHVEAQQQVFGGQERVKGASSFYINPIGIQSLVISAAELGNKTTLTTDSLTPHSVRAHLSKDEQSAPAVSFPLVQGMSCVTAQFEGAKPVLQSGVSFKTVTRVTREPKKGVVKYNFVLADGTTWRIYGWHTKGDGLELTVANDGRAESKRAFTGVLQVCKDPKSEGSEAALDDGAGVFAETVGLSGSVAGSEGRYRLQFKRDGHKDGQLNMYALPHHVDSFDDATRKLVRPKVQLQTPTKGVATLVCGEQWTLVETAMPTDMGFAPWHPERGNVEALSEEAKRTIRAAAARELAQDMAAQSNIDSMYFSGKALAKFATAVWVAKRMLGDEQLAETGLGRVQAAFATFASNRQRFPLTYETAWGGVVSRASYDTGDGGVDFGNTLYNDHHFHYGYHILAAATIADLDPGWGKANGDYVRTLARDVANPSTSDGLFPVWRCFDWYHGHSWAHGLYASMDGKNQESSSEDMMAAYALKMWGRVSGDGDLESRSNLQLSVLARSLRAYYLYEADNAVQPRRFIGNKVAGILFENKVDHTTFFDGSIEAIQGIHMIPILAPTAFVRRPRFVSEEWETYFSKGRIDSVGSAWKSIVYASYATVDPAMAYKFFTSKDFQPQWLDGGASLTWFMAYAAAPASLALGGGIIG